MNQQPDNRSHENVFLNVYEHCSVNILSFLRRKVGEKDAEDLAQEVWVRFNRELPKLEPESNYRAWLFRVARNVTIDFYRRNRPSGSINTEEGSIDPPDPGVFDIHTEYAADLEMIAYRECLEELPGSWATVFRLRLEGMPYKEMAVELQQRVNSLEKNLLKAKNALSACIEKKVGA